MKSQNDRDPDNGESSEEELEDRYDDDGVYPTANKFGREMWMRASKEIEDDFKEPKYGGVFWDLLD